IETRHARACQYCTQNVARRSRGKRVVVGEGQVVEQALAHLFAQSGAVVAVGRQMERDEGRAAQVGEEVAAAGVEGELPPGRRAEAAVFRPRREQVRGVDGRAEVQRQLVAAQLLPRRQFFRQLRLVLDRDEQRRGQPATSR